ncbi:MFS transporter [Paracoccus marinaquae]|uniref:MFS transporter n=1 Tax=Paracoccus marinaquae TaxID=2841926 RepID=A0ABS6AGH5_9RHOB|nr:MFS transporter [Paracoccus marinaquae]MBU3029684.1 MFS transporter [Paracoccus marinaquae]
MPETAPSRRNLAAYGVLTLPLAFGGLPLYIHAPDFFATERGVSLAALGLALFWLRLFDAVLDPVAGWAGDRWPSARGRLIVAGAVLLACGCTALFASPALPVLIWSALAMALASLGHSLISVNLMTLGGLWRREPGQKSRISAAREGFGLAGLILAGVLPSALQPLIGRQTALLALAAVLAVALLIALPIFRGWLASVRLQIAVPPDARPHWRALMPFYAVAALVLLSAAFPAALILMLVRDLLGVEALAGAFLLTYFAAALPGAAIAGWLAGRIGAVPVWSGALILSMAGFAFALTLGSGDSAAFFAICLATGVCFGADLVLPPAILSDRIETTSAQSAATRAYAVLGLLAKLALALAVAVALPLLQLAGFRPADANDTNSLQALLLLYAALPLVLRGVAVTALILLHRKGEI